MKPGPAPTPTALRVLRGTAKPAAAEPQPDTALPDCPPHLNDEAVAEWRRITPELLKLGLLSYIDRAALAGYCVAWSRWVEAEMHVAEHGAVVKSPNGFPVQNPFLSIANKALKQVKEFAAEFGLTPSARTRVKAGKTAKPSGKSRFFK